jgi:phosphoglycerol transferase MdoB-like AlkP superfamily enzyme
MRDLIQPLKRIFLQTFLLLSCYFISRCIFTILNLEKFDGLTFGEFIRLSFFALRFDISTIVSLNWVYFFLFLLPTPFRPAYKCQQLVQVLFVTINSIAFAFELSDWAYFPFTLKRQTSDVLQMIGRKGDFINLLPHFLVDYWYVPLALSLLVFLFWRMNRGICRKTPLHQPEKIRWKVLPLRVLAICLITALSVVGLRGGLQLIPIGNGNALQVAENKFVPIVLNTPFSIMHSYSGKMQEVKFFPHAEAIKYFNPIKKYSSRSFRNRNVVFIILEGFSKEFTGIGGRITYTPFLDSLMRNSFVCTNAFANALHSAEGIPSILSGTPTLMEEPITTSSYGTNKLTSLPMLLREQGYQTAFFHGGTNGTMSFDIYASNAGFSRYYGRTEYNNESDYDRNWGIWDEPFLQYFATNLGNLSQPFMASVFTLTSHDPFVVPDKYKNSLPKRTSKVHQSVAYTDLAVKEFFKTASAQPWFHNTLFVITADHCSPVSDDPYYSSVNMGIYSIPIIFYSPGDSSLNGQSREYMQQIDILPSVLDYLGYDKSFFAFGNSIFQPAAKRFVVNELSGNNKWLMDGYLLNANGMQPAELFDFRNDSMCRHNIILKQPQKARELTDYFHAFIQLYRYAVIHNKMTVEAWDIK